MESELKAIDQFIFFWNWAIEGAIAARNKMTGFGKLLNGGISVVVEQDTIRMLDDLLERLNGKSPTASELDATKWGWECG